MKGGMSMDKEAKYQTTITGWGDEAKMFLGTDNAFIVIFDENAPSELAEISVLHKHAELKANPMPGDTVRICGREYIVTDVGSEAPMTLREMGHCCLSFKGLNQVERPGEIELLGDPLRPEDIVEGGVIEIV